MIKIFILILVFSSVGLISRNLLPLVVAKARKSRKKEFDETVEKLDKMFVEVKREKLFFLFALGPVILGIAGYILFQNLLAVLTGLGLGIVLPRLVVKNIEKRRKQKFQNQLIDASLLLSNSLKSGLSLLQAIEVVTEELPPPMSQEFGYVIKEIQMGVSLEEALLRLKKRMYSEGLNMMVTSILVSRETGGDLTKIFERLVSTIRQKNKIAQQVKTLTLQARWQGTIMAALPIVFAFFISRLNPHYFTAMLNSETGKALLLYALVSQVIGIIMIRHLSKVEV